MIKKLNILIAFLLTVTFCFCQKDYPKKVLINNDTIIAITENQLKDINKTFLELEKCETVSNLIYNQLYLKDTLIDNYKNQLQIKDTIIKMDSLIILNKNKQIGILEYENYQNKKTIKRKSLINKLMFAITSVIVITTLMLVN